MKYMNTKKKYTMPMNLQFFADEGGDAGDAGEGDDQDDDSSDKDGADAAEKKFSQKDVDTAIEKRIARERRKWQREQEKPHNKKEDGNAAEGDKNKDGQGSEETQKRIAAEAKAEMLEMKWTCMEHDVDKKCVDDVAALAHSYMGKNDKLDFEDAIDKVLEKYPQFKVASGSKDDEEEKPNTKKSWGERQKSTTKKLTGVEAAFLKSNPGLKMD